MTTEMEKAHLTELHVRMDCNGCIQKIKKAMHAVEGVYDVYVDYPQQKITVVGRVEPEILVKAIKRAKKTATVCSHTDPTAAAAAVPSEAPPVESAPPADDPPKVDPPPVDAPNDPPTAGPPEDQEAKDVEEAHMVHHYPHSYVYREHWNNFPDPIHSYSSHRPLQYVSGYVSEYGHGRLSSGDVRYGGSIGGYGNGYYQNRGGDANQVTSMFSDENPNACRIA